MEYYVPTRGAFSFINVSRIYGDLSEYVCLFAKAQTRHLQVELKIRLVSIGR